MSNVFSGGQQARPIDWTEIKTAVPMTGLNSMSEGPDIKPLSDSADRATKFDTGRAMLRQKYLDTILGPGIAEGDFPRYGKASDLKKREKLMELQGQFNSDWDVPKRSIAGT